MAGLAVKVDQVAALRGVRKSQSPDPVTAATMAELAGADGIIVHLRLDRKHIKDRDVRFYEVSSRANSSWKWPRHPRWSVSRWI